MLPLILVAGTAGLTGPAMPFPTLDPSSAEEPSFFLLYADIQGNYRRGHDALVARVLGERTELVFHVGDISADSGKDHSSDFLPTARPLAQFRLLDLFRTSNVTAVPQ